MQSDLYLGIKLYEWLTLLAIILGPVLAVWVTRFHDKKRAINDRQTAIFRALLSTRQTKLDRDHVNALNLIEVEFYSNSEVRSKHASYVNHLGRSSPQGNGEDAFYRERSDLFAEMLQSIGKALGYEFDKQDLDRRSYSPAGWHDEHQRLQRNAALLTELLEGRRPLPIFHLLTDQGKWPAPPKDTQNHATTAETPPG